MLSLGSPFSVRTEGKETLGLCTGSIYIIDTCMRTVFLPSPGCCVSLLYRSVGGLSWAFRTQLTRTSLLHLRSSS